MIVWVSSFPRSGNTFLRIALNRLYGVRTSVVYDVDGVAERLGADLVGFTERPAAIDAMRESEAVHLVKTHRQRDDQVDELDKAICLVRDGRDALVSWARLASEEDSTRFASELSAMIARRDKVGTGSWGRNVLSWLRPPAPHRVVLRYEELAREPRAAIEQVMATLVPQLRPLADARIPSFTELQQSDDRFFRKGLIGAHRDELPDELHHLFWAQPDNVAAMQLLGYGTKTDD
ncbi:sulfotransferase domain-containing protein [Micromonospora tarensis]|uniref:Sulfotransferase domain-containing protein n=1 Tax=Micromonospora tarensis TaxID=2806100 RepID=A0ABS1YBK6_9ACTN|nr:sulfotransferase domain-containing protein [Micromonospora tarensis]MBM0274789.1 sulfotransferase domain-containing protein [Micromonospora tarensis]